MTVTAGLETVELESAQVGHWPMGVILRDITRGGIAGLIVGVVVGGLGGRVAMRLAALIVPDAEGSFTENGNRIGDITLDGSREVIIFGGLFAGIFAGTLWVVVRPWLPASLQFRAIAAIPLAIGLGSFGIIQATNRDFIVLGHDALVVGVLIALVGLVGPAMAVVDAWLDRHLPHPASATDPRTTIYTGITVIGLFFAVGVAATYLGNALPVGIALLVAGLTTLSWWLLRYRGIERPPTGLRLVASTAVVAAALFGLALAIPEVQGALGVR